MSSQKCPFKAGDTVIYRPTDKGRSSVIMTELASLVPGDKYKIIRIDGGVYVLIEGFETAAGGGLYWTEFSTE